tara:strand:- start:31138 stop:31467 length:330 start_codon:yes stop_codon:yes gene_type:complete
MASLNPNPFPLNTMTPTSTSTPTKPHILTEDLKQFNIFTAMLHQDNHHFLNEACRLLVRKRDTQNHSEMVAYDKLMELVTSVKRNKPIVESYFSKYDLRFLCVPNYYPK